MCPKLDCYFIASLTLFLSRRNLYIYLKNLPKSYFLQGNVDHNPLEAP